MDTLKRYTRFVKKIVCEELVHDSRNRCCVSGCTSRTLIPGEVTSQVISAILHRHHLIYYSDGGPPTAKNLVLVCPNCHAFIHQHPNKYTIESIIRDKAHWLGMVDVVPSILDMGSSGEAEDMIVLPFTIESLNLSYSLRIPRSATVSDVAGFVAERVLTPLGKYDNYEDWIHPDRVELALRSATKAILNPFFRVSSISMQSDDALVAIVHVRAVAAPARQVVLFAHPATPAAGQDYVATTSVDFAYRELDVEMRVEGTDGYRNAQTGPFDSSGEFHLNVPGAKGGVVDTIEARVGGIILKITIVFRSRLERDGVPL